MQAASPASPSPAWRAEQAVQEASLLRAAAPPIAVPSPTVCAIQAVRVFPEALPPAALEPTAGPLLFASAIPPVPGVFPAAARPLCTCADARRWVTRPG